MENATEIRSLWADLDDALIPGGNLKPTAVVETSPEHYHCYWRLTEAIHPTTAEKLNRSLTDKIAAHNEASTLIQPLRVPGTRNYKYRKQPPTVKVVNIAENIAYPPGELADLVS